MKKTKKRESYAEIGIRAGHTLIFMASQDWMPVFEDFGRVKHRLSSQDSILFIHKEYKPEEVEEFLRWRVTHQVDPTPQTKGKTVNKNELGHVLRNERVICFNADDETREKIGEGVRSWRSHHEFELRVPEGKDFDRVLAEVASVLGEGEGKNYTFETRDVADIDVQRICDENPLADALLVTFEGNDTSGMLLLNERFLARFQTPDRVEVAGSLLSPDWGSPYLNLRYHKKSCYPVTGYAGDKMSGWRCRGVTLPIEHLVKQLEAARAFERKFVTKVHRL